MLFCETERKNVFRIRSAELENANILTHRHDYFGISLLDCYFQFFINSVWLLHNWCQINLFPNSLTTIRPVQFALTFFFTVLKDDLLKEQLLKYAGGFAQNTKTFRFTFRHLSDSYLVWHAEVFWFLLWYCCCGLKKTGEEKVLLC